MGLSPGNAAAFAAVLLPLAAAGGCGDAAPATLPVPHAPGPIRIDGLADEPDWARAAEFALSRAGDHGRVRLLCDARHLYLTVACPGAARVSQDALILRVTGGRGVHLKFDPSGMCWDLRAAAPRPAMLRPELVNYATVVNRARGEWTIEAGVPFTAFAAAGHPVVLHLSRIGAYREGDDRPAQPLQAQQDRRLVLEPVPLVQAP